MEKELELTSQEDFWQSLGETRARVVLCLLLTSNLRALPDDKLWLSEPSSCPTSVKAPSSSFRRDRFAEA